jgi:hypothetical protein
LYPECKLLARQTSPYTYEYMPCGIFILDAWVTFELLASLESAQLQPEVREFWRLRMGREHHRLSESATPRYQDEDRGRVLENRIQLEDEKAPEDRRAVKKRQRRAKDVEGKKRRRVAEAHEAKNNAEDAAMKRKRTADWNELIWMDYSPRPHPMDGGSIDAMVYSNKRIQGATARGTNEAVHSVAMVSSVEASRWRFEEGPPSDSLEYSLFGSPISSINDLEDREAVNEAGESTNGLDVPAIQVTEPGNGEVGILDAACEADRDA